MNAIIFTGGGKGNPLPQWFVDEFCSKEFWDKMDAIRDSSKYLRKDECSPELRHATMLEF